MENILNQKQQLERLTQEATRLGATSAAIISSKEIQVKDNLAALCNGDYICPNYGLAASCPPHVEGPTEFRKWQALSCLPEIDIFSKAGRVLSCSGTEEQLSVYCQTDFQGQGRLLCAQTLARNHRREIQELFYGVE